MNTLNIWPIIVSTVTAFIIGSLWYSPILFGKEWLSLVNISDAEMTSMKGKGMIAKYFVQLIATAVTFCVLAFIIAETSITNATDGAYLGLIIWLGFTVPTGLSGILWKRHSFQLFWIEAMSSLLTLLIGGAIIGGWR